MDRERQVRQELERCGRGLLAKGLVWGRSGNISARLEPNAFLISAAGADLGALGNNDYVRCSVDPEVWQGEQRPSIETGMHRRIYAACGKAAAVIHSQPFYSTFVACSDAKDLRTDLLPETMAYLGRIERVPYRHPGSQELAEAVASKVGSSRVLLLANHGVICWGASLDEALIATETLEYLCRLVVTAQATGQTLSYLGAPVVEDFARHLRQLGRQP